MKDFSSSQLKLPVKKRFTAINTVVTDDSFPSHCSIALDRMMIYLNRCYGNGNDFCIFTSAVSIQNFPFPFHFFLAHNNPQFFILCQFWTQCISFLHKMHAIFNITCKPVNLCCTYKYICVQIIYLACINCMQNCISIWNTKPTATSENL